MLSVLTSSPHRNRLFLPQLEPYLGGFFYFCFCRAELSEPVRLDHKLGKRNSFVCCSACIPESFCNGFSRFLINPRDWAQVSQGRAVCAWCCVYSGLPRMFFEGFSLPTGLLSILDSQPQKSLSLISAPCSSLSHGIHQILCWVHTSLFECIYPLGTLLF